MDIKQEAVETQNPPPLKETERFFRILICLWMYEGFLTLRQIRRIAFPNASIHEARKYMAKMFQNGFVNRPDRQSRAAIGEQLYWLSQAGAEKVADRLGIAVSDLKYRRKLRKSLIPHDAQLNDVRLAIEGACEFMGVDILEWRTSQEFWANPIVIQIENEDGKPTKRRVMPDAFFILRVPQQINPKTGEPETLRCLLENDCSSESHSTFTFERLRVALALLRSPQYKQMAGRQSGRWLIVTNSERRMKTMKEYAERDFGEHAQAFWFSTVDRLCSSQQAAISAPVWFRGGWSEPATLLKLQR